MFKFNALASIYRPWFRTDAEEMPGDIKRNQKPFDSECVVPVVGEFNANGGIHLALNIAHDFKIHRQL